MKSLTGGKSKKSKYRNLEDESNGDKRNNASGKTPVRKVKPSSIKEKLELKKVPNLNRLKYISPDMSASFLNKRKKHKSPLDEPDTSETYYSSSDSLSDFEHKSYAPIVAKTPQSYRPARRRSLGAPSNQSENISNTDGPGGESISRPRRRSSIGRSNTENSNQNTNRPARRGSLGGCAGESSAPNRRAARRGSLGGCAAESSAPTGRPARRGSLGGCAAESSAPNRRAARRGSLSGCAAEDSSSIRSRAVRRGSLSGSAAENASSGRMTSRRGSLGGSAVENAPSGRRATRRGSLGSSAAENVSTGRRATRRGSIGRRTAEDITSNGRKASRRQSLGGCTEDQQTNMYQKIVNGTVTLDGSTSSKDYQANRGTTHPSTTVTNRGSSFAEGSSVISQEANSESSSRDERSYSERFFSISTQSLLSGAEDESSHGEISSHRRGMSVSNVIEGLQNSYNTQNSYNEDHWPVSNYFNIDEDSGSDESDDESDENDESDEEEKILDESREENDSTIVLET